MVGAVLAPRELIVSEALASPLAFDAVTVTVLVFVSADVPDNTPVAELKVKPDGNVPAIEYEVAGG